MNNEIKQEKALLYALGTLPEEEIEEFEALIKSDRELQSLVHELQLLNELEVAECESVEPPFQVYSRIMATIEESKGGGATSVEQTSSNSNKIVSFLTWSGWAAAACFAIIFASNLTKTDIKEPVVVAAATPRPAAPASDIILNNLGNPILQAVKIPSEDFTLEDRMLELASLAEAYWFSREGVPSGQLLSDPSAEVEKLSGGFTIFDRKYQIGFIAVENLPQETAGKSYHVWAKTGKGSPPLRAGALPVGEDSRGLFFFDMSSVPEVASMDRINFFVTEERSDSPETPTGMVVLSNYLR